MHLSLITEPGNDLCTKCKKSKLGVRLHVFSENVGAEGAFFCSDCLLEDDITSNVTLERPDVAEPGRGKYLRAQKRRSQEQERDLAEELGARVQKNSGALSGSKSDLRKKGELRVEAKYTEAESFRLELADLQKLLSECQGQEKPILVLDFLEKGTKRLRDRFAITAFYDLKELLDAARKRQ